MQSSTRKLYDGGAGRRSKKKSIRFRDETLARLEWLCKKLDRKKADLLEILINKKFHEVRQRADKSAPLSAELDSQ